MKKKNATKLRTTIADLQPSELTAADLARVTGGTMRGPISPGGPGGGKIGVADDHCWQASTSMTNPGDPDNAQDWVVD